MDLLGSAHLQSEGAVGQMRQMCSLHGLCLVARAPRTDAICFRPALLFHRKKEVFSSLAVIEVATQKSEETPPNSRPATFSQAQTEKLLLSK